MTVDGDESALRKVRQRAAMIFQQFNLVGRLSALENVLTARLSYRPVLPTLLRRFPPEDYERAMGCLRRVGLADRAAQRADTLSGGERQRVAIARALAQEPRILLADEPVASLDPRSTHQVLELIRRVSREDGLTVLMSLHQVGLARQFSDRVAGLAGGRLVFEGLRTRWTTRRWPPSTASRPTRRRTMAASIPWRSWPTPEGWEGTRSRWTLLGWGAAAVVLAWAAHGADLRLHELVRGAPYMADFLRRMFPPNLDYVPALLGPTLETLQMAIWGTVLAIGLAAPLGVLAARNLTPHPACFWAARGLLNAMRGINELVFALVFVAAVGLGPCPACSRSPSTPPACSGSSTRRRWRAWTRGRWRRWPRPAPAASRRSATRCCPRCCPPWSPSTSTGSRCRSGPPRSSAWSGPGGIGFELMTSMRLFKYRDVAVILVAIVGLVVLTDAVSTRVRKRYL